ncbi:MAG: CoA pyrophosphatase [Proteobacteria bacterium]|nr:CoA pyrophosphatase [Pseudomonadota bacterium]
MSALYHRLDHHHRAGHSVPLADPYVEFTAADAAQFRPAAVLIALTERPQPGVLLLHRPETMRSHPGQVAFPGGRIDPGESPEEAALREAEEELGLDAAKVRVVGTSDTYLTGSGYEVTPVLAIVPPDLPLAPNPHEVAEWFEAPAGFVFNPANQNERSGHWRGRERHYYEIVWQGHRIWGVTAGIIANLTRRIDWAGVLDG